MAIDYTVRYSIQDGGSNHVRQLQAQNMTEAVKVFMDDFFANNAGKKVRIDAITENFVVAAVSDAS